MNLKKFKKSLVSIVLGSSLFIGNGGGIFQHPKAWLSDEFFTTARETYKDDQKIQLLLIVSEFLSELSRPSTLETEFLSLKEKLLGEISDLTLYKYKISDLTLYKYKISDLILYNYEMLYLGLVMEYLKSLGPLLTRSDKLAELREKLMSIVKFCTSDSIYQSENTKNSLSIKEVVNIDIVALVLLFSILQENFEISDQVELWTCIENLCQTNNQLTNSASPCWMIVFLKSLFTEKKLDEFVTTQNAELTPQTIENCNGLLTDTIRQYSDKFIAETLRNIDVD